MARDYEDFSSIDDLDDDELRQLVRDRLGEHPELDLDDISVVVDQGTVRLEGRVGTEAELRMADHVLTDVVGVVDYDNSLVVDALRRVETPVDIEDHLNEERRNAGSIFGEMPEQDSPEVDLNRGDEDLDERMFGTTNVQDAIAHGVPYVPPESPTSRSVVSSSAALGSGGLGSSDIAWSSSACTPLNSSPSALTRRETSCISAIASRASSPAFLARAIPCDASFWRARSASTSGRMARRRSSRASA